MNFKKIIICGTLGFFTVINAMATLGCTGLEEDYTDVQTENNQLVKDLKDVEKEEKETYKDFCKNRDKYDKAKSEYDEKVAEKEEKEEAERLKQEKIEKQKEKEAEKQKYETGITYEQLNRHPDTYMDEYVKFQGEILQYQEGGVWSDTVIRLAVNGDYDKVLYVEIPSDILDSDNRIAEGEYITVRGTSMGIMTYETVLGANVSIPGVSAEKIYRW